MLLITVSVPIYSESSLFRSMSNIKKVSQRTRISYVLDSLIAQVVTAWTINANRTTFIVH